MMDTEELSKVQSNLNLCIQSDGTHNGHKRVILAISHLYPLALKALKA